MSLIEQTELIASIYERIIGFDLDPIVTLDTMVQRLKYRALTTGDNALLRTVEQIS